MCIVYCLWLLLDKELVWECVQCIVEQQKVQVEVEGLGKGVVWFFVEVEKVLVLLELLFVVFMLCLELELMLGKLEQVCSLFVIYLEKFKIISLVICGMQGVEEVFRVYEEQFKEVQVVLVIFLEFEVIKVFLKKLWVQVEVQQFMFDVLWDELWGVQEVGE